MKLLSKTNYIGALTIGFLFTYLINYFGNKDRMQETIAIFSNHCFHIHHWIICLFIICVLLIGHYLKSTSTLYLIISFLIGVSIEDLMFKDFYKIKDNCHGKKLIKMLKKNSGV
jgi:hypothetical protein